MLKKLSLSACALILGSGLAVAGSPELETGRSTATEPSSLSTANWLASEVYKAAIYDTSQQKIGDVADLVIDSSGKIATAVIGVGGVMGIGEKHVAVPFSDLKVASKDGKSWFVLDRTKEDLEKAPAYQPQKKPR